MSSTPSSLVLVASSITSYMAAAPGRSGKSMGAHTNEEFMVESPDVNRLLETMPRPAGAGHRHCGVACVGRRRSMSIRAGRPGRELVPKSVLGFIIAGAIAKSAAIVSGAGENKNHPAITIAPRIDEKFAVGGDAWGHVVEVQFSPLVFIVRQPVAGVEIVNDDDRVLTMGKDDRQLIF